MAKVIVTKELLESLGKELADGAKILAECAPDVEALFPEEKSFPMLQAPPINDAFPAISEFVAKVQTEVKLARQAKILGPASKLVRRASRQKENGE
jgi:hypothetical protein